MVAFESKINIFEEMRYFLLFYLNLGFIVQQALVLLILSNFSFLSIGHCFSRTFIHFFWQECMSTLFEVHTNFICNVIQSNERERLNIKFRQTCNAIFEKKLHKGIMKVLEKLCLINRKLKLDKVNSTNAQCSIKPKFGLNNKKYLISLNMLMFDSYATIKLSMQSTWLIRLKTFPTWRCTVVYFMQIPVLSNSNH